VAELRERLHGAEQSALAWSTFAATQARSTAGVEPPSVLGAVSDVIAAVSSTVAHVAGAAAQG
jgi:hypothetical protein